MDGPPNVTGNFQCPLQLIRYIFVMSGGLRPLILFDDTHNREGYCTFRNQCDTFVYQSYINSDHTGYVVLLDFFSDVAVMSK